MSKRQKQEFEQGLDRALGVECYDAGVEKETSKGAWAAYVALLLLFLVFCLLSGRL